MADTTSTATDSTELADRLERLIPSDIDHCSIRFMDERAQHLMVRQDVVEPVYTSDDGGILVSIWHGTGHGYAATNDVSDAGIVAAIDTAKEWARRTAGLGVLASAPHSPTAGEYQSPVGRPWTDLSLSDRIDLLRERCHDLRGDDRIVERMVTLSLVDVDTVLVSTGGGRVIQHFNNVLPSMRVVAHHDGRTQIRTFGGGARTGQGGIEVLDRLGFAEAAERITSEALELLEAPNCPSGVMDLLLAPDQMVLQIHESIGHPIELDRVLGDERNFAGTSFVTADMFGSYQYGSELLNVTFDPGVHGQLASYQYDDEGTPAQRQHLIRDGVLERPLGGAISQARAGMSGVANSRSSAWNRAPIDRMANLNVEPGDATFDELVGGVEHGVYLETNSSWSIDDSRNKFQFSTERGTLIENGQLTTVVRNPSYRGVSANFWRSLAGVGNSDTFEVLGVPTCGKGEPSQVIRVGHASPPCLFSNVEVFGGAQ